jgi:hypothetical protein
MLLLHIKCVSHPEAVRCACSVLLFLAMAAASHPAANCNALGFFRVMIEGCGGCGGCGACGGGVGGDGRRCVHLRASCNA